MARATTRTKLSLDRWAAIIGIHPAHFNGVFFGDSPSVCQQPWLQQPWQAQDRIGREEVARAIAQAEADIEYHLGYRLLPDWEEDEWQLTERPWRKELVNLSVTDIRGMAQTVEAKWGYFVSGGIRASTLIEAARPVAYTDIDGDSYAERAALTVTVDAGIDPCEIHIYYPVSNPMVVAGDEDQWEIRPIDVTIVGTTAVILFRREQAVLPELFQDYFPPADDSHLRGVDGANNANFLATVDVYRVHNDPQTQVSFLWEPFGTGCGCNNSGCVTCAFNTQTGCLMLRSEPRQSVVSYRPATWNATDEDFDAAEWACNRQPNLARLYYYAGWRDKRQPCPTVRMDPEWERTVAYYAAALLDRPICECNNIRAWVDHWQKDLAIRGDEGLQVSSGDLDNPFGTRRGAVYAWKRVNREGAAVGRAVFI